MHVHEHGHGHEHSEHEPEEALVVKEVAAGVTTDALRVPLLVQHCQEEPASVVIKHCNALVLQLKRGFRKMFVILSKKQLGKKIMGKWVKWVIWA